MTRRALIGITALALLAFGGCGGGGDKSKTDPFSAVSQHAPKRQIRAAPRWDPLASRSGSGNASERFTVGRGVIQWRARFTCRSGTIRLFAASARTPGGKRSRLAAGSCPGKGRGVSVITGPVRLEVESSGPWRVTLEQQVDRPLHEPPLAAMKAPGSTLLSRGRFYRIEGRGKGFALLYRLAGGRLALRLDRFETTANTDLFVWLSTAAGPRTSKQAISARHRVLAPLKATLGSQNYLLPRSADPAQIKSIVIWCRPVSIAYAAATLRS